MTAWAQGAVQAAVHGQDVLRGQPARLAIPAAADGEPVIDGLDLQRGELAAAGVTLTVLDAAAVARVLAVAATPDGSPCPDALAPPGVVITARSA